MTTDERGKILTEKTTKGNVLGKDQQESGETEKTYPNLQGSRNQGTREHGLT